MSLTEGRERYIRLAASAASMGYFVRMLIETGSDVHTIYASAVQAFHFAREAETVRF